MGHGRWVSLPLNGLLAFYLQQTPRSKPNKLYVLDFDYATAGICVQTSGRGAKARDGEQSRRFGALPGVCSSLNLRGHAGPLPKLVVQC